MIGRRMHQSGGAKGLVHGICPGSESDLAAFVGTEPHITRFDTGSIDGWTQPPAETRKDRTLDDD
ncbi:hypothetical protein GCM10011341_22480 [Frigidibacter albus]|nr:hypothetical protein GCM10011341_22480 [Frigidibacter albus]